MSNALYFFFPCTENYAHSSPTKIHDFKGRLALIRKPKIKHLFRNEEETLRREKIINGLPHSDQERVCCHQVISNRKQKKLKIKFWLRKQRKDINHNLFTYRDLLAPLLSFWTSPYPLPSWSPHESPEPQILNSQTPN